ncbi:craniofacial development protein 2 [Elysia marginata]|uniref:Craniofacial development protein 2 n=1 Tax=Elysia marginata TaxID=1093978 RepID=A0AAV4IDM0_9GAST|nr:craniofacial development protein 2 [Elysia marginata]
MLDKTSSDRPERRSALVAHELLRLNIDITALTEVRFPDKGSVNEHGAGYTLYWSGRQPEQRRISGVGIMIKDSLASKLETLLTGHSDRIMSMRLPLDKNQHLTLFSVYAPTLQAEPVEKDSFYSELGRLLTNTLAGDKVLILGDFNARVGRDSDTWNGILGRHGVGNCKEYGRLLLGFCAEHQLTVTNTVFQQKDRLKTTWMHPRSNHWHLLDYILVRKQDLRDVLHTRVMPSAECSTDHCLVRCKLNLKFKPKPKRKGKPLKKINVSKLSIEEIVAKFQADLEKNLNALPDLDNPTPENVWDNLKSSILKSSEVTLGYTKRLHRDCSDGQQLLTEIPDTLTRWAEHLNTLFSTDRSVQDAALHRIPHLPLIEELDDPPTLEETITAIGQLKSHKAAGIDGIPPEIWKKGGVVLHGKLHELLVCCWEQGNLPQDLRDAVVITLYKNKGEN